MTYKRGAAFTLLVMYAVVDYFLHFLELHGYVVEGEAAVGASAATKGILFISRIQHDLRGVVAVQWHHCLELGRCYFTVEALIESHLAQRLYFLLFGRLLLVFTRVYEALVLERRSALIGNSIFVALVEAHVDRLTTVWIERHAGSDRFLFGQARQH